jgi:hypothetical protein
VRKIRLRVTSGRTLIGMLLALAVLLAGLFAPGMVLQRKVDAALYTRYLLQDESAVLSQTALTKDAYGQVLEEYFPNRNDMLSESVLLFRELVDGQISMNAANNTALETAKQFEACGLIPYLETDSVTVADSILLNATGLQDPSQIDYRASFWRVQMYDENGTYVVMWVNAMDACVWDCYVELDTPPDAAQILLQYAGYLECVTPQQQMEIEVETVDNFTVGMARLPLDSFNIVQECAWFDRDGIGWLHFYIAPGQYSWQQLLLDCGMAGEDFYEAQERMEYDE